MNNSIEYNITIDHEDGVCNIIYGALNPFFTTASMNSTLIYQMFTQFK